MDRPFIYIDPDDEENQHYHPEAIIAFILLVGMGCIVGSLMALGIWALVTRTVF